MKMFVAAAAAALLLAPVFARAECSATDFKVASFDVKVDDPAHPVMKMPGELVNNCKEASAAQIEIEAKAADGSVVQKKKLWPAGTTNIAPGGSVKFDAGKMFRFDASMKTYAVVVVSVHSF